MHQISNINFWISLVVLAIVAYFVPEPFNMFLFLGAIFVMVFEVSDRLREHYYIHKRNGEHLERIAELLERIESNTENAASYLYEGTEEQVRELSEEESQQQPEQVQKIHILCRLAESHLDDLSDEYESNKLKERIDTAIHMAKKITDPFYFGAALHPVINLANQAGWNDKKNEILEMISDPLIKQKIIKSLNTENT